jgi:hypothetical protein
MYREHHQHLKNDTLSLTHPHSKTTLSQERDIHAIHAAALDAVVDAATGNRSVGGFGGGDEFDMIERSPVYDDLICPAKVPDSELSLRAGSAAAGSSNTGFVSSCGVDEQDSDIAASSSSSSPRSSRDPEDGETTATSLSSSSPRSEFVRRPDPAAAFERWERAQTAKEADRWASLPVVREVQQVFVTGCDKGWCKTLLHLYMLCFQILYSCTVNLSSVVVPMIFQTLRHF